MKAHSIIYSAPMARAKVAGIKTQTRRPLVCALDITAIGTTEQWARGLAGNHCFGRTITEADIQRKADDLRGRLHPLIRSNGSMVALQCPYGQPGDTLNGRETFWAWGRWEVTFSDRKRRDAWHFVDMTSESGLNYLYDADAPPPSLLKRQRRHVSSSPSWWKRPAIHMPGRAARIRDVIVSVRVERLHDISDADAIAEGLVRIEGGRTIGDRISNTTDAPVFGLPEWTTESFPSTRMCPSRWNHSAAQAYRHLWGSTNGAGSWDANPFVWVIETRRL